MRDDDGDLARPVPGAGSAAQLWILGSSDGLSARVAGARGLPFTANYHVSPSAVPEAVRAYRDAFQPSEHLPRPWVMASADMVVAEDDEQARYHASPYGPWVRSIRAGGGAVPFPTPEQVAAAAWSDQDRELVADRVDTQFVGTAETVAERLGTLRRVTGADESLVTTITHDHAARARSFQLLAKEWLGWPGGATGPEDVAGTSLHWIISRDLMIAAARLMPERIRRPVRARPAADLGRYRPAPT